MQLKRYTDYALRIMVCLEERLKRDRSLQGVPAPDVIAAAGIPIVSFNRICGLLEEHRLIYRKISRANEVRLYPGENFKKQSLLSVAEAVEGNMDVFAVFDRQSSVVQMYESKLFEVQRKMYRELSGVTIAKLAGER